MERYAGIQNMAISTIRFLSQDAVQRAYSEIPGLLVGNAIIA
jgi:transketolase